MPRAHVVIGTAGHIDHGKTSLVEALTGTKQDRLPEEKRRGITIDLGFAGWEAPGLSASIIDVPGHERFVQTMVAGAAGLDLVMLVVAADDSVMPETREHLAICDLLGVSGGLVVLTKCDLADEEMLGLVVDDVKSATRGTFLENAEIVRTSVKDGSGLEEVGRAVVRALGTLPRAIETGPPWLAIDRVFTKHGFGTVVTGTLVRGSIAQNDALVAMPTKDGGADPVVVRGMTIHGAVVERASASTRLALNLRGADRARIGRGTVLTRPGAQRTTTAMDVDLRLLPDARRLDARSELVAHVGTAHSAARPRALAPTSLGPGEHGIVRLTLSSPLAVYVGQRFVLRRPELGAHRTIGGGAVVDPHPLLGRRRKGEPRAWEASDLAERITSMVAEASGVTPGVLAERLPFEVDLERMLNRLTMQRALFGVGTGKERRFFSPSHLTRAKTRALAAVTAFHRDHPALAGATAIDLEGRLPASLRALAVPALQALASEGALVGGERVSLPTHDARATCERVAEIYRAHAMTPGTEAAMQEQSGLGARMFKDVVAELVRAGRLHRVAAGIHFHESALTDVRLCVETYFETHETLAPGDFKALTGLTRKNAIALLEWLDERGVTRREGEVRVRA